MKPLRFRAACSLVLVVGSSTLVFIRGKTQFLSCRCLRGFATSKDDGVLESTSSEGASLLAAPGGTIGSTSVVHVVDVVVRAVLNVIVTAFSSLGVVLCAVYSSVTAVVVEPVNKLVVGERGGHGLEVCLDNVVAQRSEIGAFLGGVDEVYVEHNFFLAALLYSKYFFVGHVVRRGLPEAVGSLENHLVFHLAEVSISGPFADLQVRVFFDHVRSDLGSTLHSAFLEAVGELVLAGTIFARSVIGEFGSINTLTDASVVVRVAPVLGVSVVFVDLEEVVGGLDVVRLGGHATSGIAPAAVGRNFGNLAA